MFAGTPVTLQMTRLTIRAAKTLLGEDDPKTARAVGIGLADEGVAAAWAATGEETPRRAELALAPARGDRDNGAARFFSKQAGRLPVRALEGATRGDNGFDDSARGARGGSAAPCAGPERCSAHPWACRWRRSSRRPAVTSSPVARWRPRLGHGVLQLSLSAPPSPNLP